MCTAYSNSVTSRTSTTLNEALDFLEKWIMNDKGGSSTNFLTKLWQTEESVEVYVADLETLAAPLLVKSSDRQFKLRFIESLPKNIKPFFRMELQGASWPSINQLVEKVKLLNIHPSTAINCSTESEEPSPVVNAALPPKNPQRPSSSRPLQPQLPAPTRMLHPQHDSTSPRSLRCYNCSGYGHVARVCPSAQRQSNQGNFRRL
jgi:hypothetical protein